MRDTFGKELKKVNNKKSGQASDTETDSKWPYFKLLLFLDGTMTRRDLKGSLPGIEISAEDSCDEGTFCAKAFKATKGSLLPKRIKHERMEDTSKYVRKESEPDTAKDICTSFASYVAQKLKKYSENGRAVVQHRIYNIFFDIDMARFTNYQQPSSIQSPNPPSLAEVINSQNPSSALQSSDKGETDWGETL